MHRPIPRPHDYIVPGNTDPTARPQKPWADGTPVFPDERSES